MATQEDLDRQNSINLSIQERLALLERERSTLLEEADIYKRLLGTNLDLSQVRSRYQSDEKDILQTIRTNTNILKDQAKQITFQVAEKSRIQKISNDILSISENSYSMLMEELGTSKNISDIEKKRETLAKRLIELESFRGTIIFEDKELQAAFNEELENSIKGAADLEAQLTDTQNASEKINKSIRWFEDFKEGASKLGLGKFTDAFKAAEEAARETAVANELSKKVANELVAAKEEEAKAISTVQTAEEELQKFREENKQAMLDENKQRNDIKNSLKEKESILSKITQLSQEELETGEGLTAERLKALGLENQTKGLAGTAAKEKLKAIKAQLQAESEKDKISLNNLEYTKKERNEKLKSIKDTLNQAKQDKITSGNRVKGLKGQQKQLAKMTGKAGMNGLMAGAKALIPILKKAMGPVSILLMVKDVIKFFVDALFQASKTVAELRQNLGVSNAEANRIRHSFNAIANAGDEFNKSQEGVLILSKQIQQSFGELNTMLGTTIDFTKEFGGEGESLLRTVSLLRDNFKLSEGAIKSVVKEQIRSGRTAEDINTSVAAEIEFRNQLNNTAFDYRKILEDVSKLSYTLQATYGLSTEKLAGAVYEARKMGFELEDLNSMSDNLLDFEGSIAKELEAELMLGKNLNLEKARQLALEGDLVGVGKEMMRNDIDVIKLREEGNVLAAKAAAAAMGMTEEQAAKAQALYREQLGLEQRLADFRTKENKKLTITDKNNQTRVITYQELQNKNIKELKDLASQAQVDFDDLAKIVGEQRIQGLLAEDAQAKFNKALEKAKEQFANLVNSGLLDKLAAGLSRFLDSWVFKKLTGMTDEESDLIKGVDNLRKLQEQGVNVDQSIIDQGQELLNRINAGEDASDVLDEGLATLKNVADLNKQTASLVNPEELQKAIDNKTKFEVSEEVQTRNENTARAIQANSSAVNKVTGNNFAGAAFNSVIPGGALMGSGIELLTGENPLEHVGGAINSQMRSSFVNDSIILPEKNEVIIPDKKDVIATFKPGGIISNTLSSTEGTTQQSFIEGVSSLLNSIKSEISKPETNTQQSFIEGVSSLLNSIKSETNTQQSFIEGVSSLLNSIKPEISKPETNTNFSFVDTIKNSMKGISSLFNSFISKSNPTPEPSEVNITELAKTGITAVENYAKVIGTSLEELLSKQPTPEVPDDEKTLKKLELELLKGEKVDDNTTLKELTVSLDELRRERSAPLETTTIIDNSELVKEITQLRKELNQLNNRPVQVQSTINMDGNQVATALGMGSYTLGNQI